MTEATSFPLPLWARRIVYAVGVLFALLLTALLTVWLFLKSPLGEALIVDAVTGLLSEDRSITVDVGDIEGDLPARMTFRDVVLQDQAGTWLTLDRLSVEWTPLGLFAGQIRVDGIDAGVVALRRLPDFGAASAPSDDGLDVDELAGLLMRLRIDAATIDRLNIAEQVAGRPLSLSVRAEVEPDDEDRPSFTLNIADLESDGRLDGSAALGRNGLISADLAAEYLGSQLKLDGTVNVRTEELAAQGAVSLSPATLPEDAGVTFATVSADINVSGTASAPQVRLFYRGADVGLSGVVLPSVDGVAEAQWASGTLSIDVSGGVTGLAQLLGDLAPVVRDEGLYALTGAIRPNADGSLAADITTVSLESGDVSVEVSGRVNLDDLSLTGRGAVRTLGLGRLATLADDSSQLTLDIDLDSVSPEGLAASFAGDVTGLTVGGSALAALADESLPLSGRLTSDWQAFTLSAFEIAGEQVRASADAIVDLGAQTINATASWVLRELSAASDVVSGEMSGDATVSGALSAPLVNVQVRSPALSIRQETLSDIDLTATLDLSQLPQPIALDGTFGVVDGDLAIAAQGEIDSERATIESMSVRGAGTRIDGTLIANLSQGLVSGEIVAALESLALPAALLGLPLSGSAETTVTLSDAGNQQEIVVDGTLANIRYAGAEAGLRSAQFKGRWTGGEDPRLDVSLTGENGFIGSQPVATLSADVSGPMSSLAFEASAQAPSEVQSVFAAGAVAQSETETSVTLAQFELTDTWGALTLDQPATVTVSPTDVRAPEVNFTANGGSFAASLDLDRAAGSVAAQVRASDLPFDLLSTLDPDLPVTGVFDLNAEVTGALAAPSASLRLTTTNISLPDTGLDGVAANISLTAQGGQMTVDAAVRGLSDSPATLTGTVPLILNLADTQIRVPLEDEISLSLAWAGAVEPVWVLLPLVAHRMAGAADIDLALRGTLEQPRLSGFARLTDGSYENLDLGTLLRDVTVELDAESISAVTVTASATDGDDGRISGQGRIVRDNTGEFTGGLTLTLDETRLVRRDDIKLRGSGELTYSLTPERDRIDGNVDVRSAELSLNATYVESVPVLDVVDPDAPAPTARRRAGKETDLDVRITAPQGLDVVGRGLDSEWAADIQLGGTLAAPELNGNLDVLRGEFAFLGELFTLSQGQVLFTGGGQIDPALSVAASRSTGGITARVELGGRASAPTVTLASDPPLPQDEVLARILFGKSAGQLGPLEAVQLANAATELTGIAGRGGVVGTLRRGVGLDVLRFGSDAGGSTVVVGERLSRNIFVGVEQGLEGQGSQLIIEWQLTDNLAAKSTTRQDTGSDIGLEWSRDY